jgi:hypothetical protein
MASMLAFGQTESAVQPGNPSNISSAPPMLGIYWAKDVLPGGKKPPNPDLVWLKGEIMPTVSVHPIFWGTSWPTDQSDKISGLESFYIGFNGSGYAHASDEYTGKNGQVTSAVAYTGYTIDGTPASGGNVSGAIFNEVCKVIGKSAVHNGYYPVYVDLPRGNVPGCSWHSAGTCNGVVVQFAFFWNLDGDRCGDTMDTSGLHSQGLASLAATSAHEISEARTDPANGGWRTSDSLYESADLCGSPSLFPHPLVTFSNGSQWKLWGLWSNHAYDTNTGFPNSTGYNGCIDN